MERITGINNLLAGDLDADEDSQLTEGVKNHLKKKYMWEKYKKFTVSTGNTVMGLSKGTKVELLSIDALNLIEGTAHVKNEQLFENDFLCGKPDILVSDNGKVTKIIDVKTSWDVDTFAQNIDTELDDVYWWQLQAYFVLTGATEGEVSFFLISTPQELVDKQIQRFLDEGYSTSPEELAERTNYDDIPMSERRITFKVSRDEDCMKWVYARIKKCREYLEHIESVHCSA
jgi:hypothetical protein